jgi:NADH:ubiquinone oxidoreductase subunit E
MLSTEALKRIDREIAKYPAERRQSAVMAALIIAQDEKGWLSPEVMEFVARYLGMAPVAVSEVASFYTMYNREQTGTHKLTICTCLPCGLRARSPPPITCAGAWASASTRPRRTAGSPSRRASAWAPARWRPSCW